MPTFSSPDGTVLAYHVNGQGAPVICLPGGPMQDSAYLGELGGLPAHRQVVTLDLRGTGQSGVPKDPSSYRCDRLVADVEALRQDLGLERFDLLAHSAGANLAALYVSQYPERISKLALITPSTFAAGIAVTGEARREVAVLRKDESWFAPAFAALEAIVAGEGTDDDWAAIGPFFYGRWDAAAAAHRARGSEQKNTEASAVFGVEGAFDPKSTRTALAGFDAPVLLLAGEVDLNTPPSVATEFAELFSNAELVIQPGAGHFPWLDDPDRFVAITGQFLS